MGFNRLNGFRDLGHQGGQTSCSDYFGKAFQLSFHPRDQTIHQPGITSALCGAKRPDQIRETTMDPDTRGTARDILARSFGPMDAASAAAVARYDAARKGR